MNLQLSQAGNFFEVLNSAVTNLRYVQVKRAKIWQCLEVLQTIIGHLRMRETYGLKTCRSIKMA